jgi:hypothetical protein
MSFGMPAGGGLNYYQRAGADALDHAPLSVGRSCDTRSHLARRDAGGNRALALGACPLVPP